MKSSESPAHLHHQDPKDPRNFVYAVFYWLGIGSLLPWNFFISVHYYWMFKFRTVEDVSPVNDQDAVVTDTVAAVVVAAGNETTPTRGLNELQTQWSSLLAVASMVPNVLFLLLNALFGHRYRSQPRMLVSLSLVIVLFVVTAVLAKVDTDQWQNEFFIVTMICVVLINVNGSIFQGT
jgi:equilibrative nucleoside transporter 1/2/3